MELMCLCAFCNAFDAGSRSQPGYILEGSYYIGARIRAGETENMLALDPKIILQPMGAVDGEVLRFLEEKLSPLGKIDLLPPIPLLEDAYNPLRRQYEGESLLQSLPFFDLTLGVVEVDIYAEGLNFIFGLAMGRRALISLKRLRQEFYGLPENRGLLQLRALKEAVHELGHLFGLIHCPDQRCVMHFSNSLVDTDYKRESYCPLCGADLPFPANRPFNHD
jgi:archaemetzincin